MPKSIRADFFTPKLRINKLKNLSSFTQLKEEEGFTLVELIVVVMMIGILSSIAIPQFMTAADKAKQKEATGIVAALVKAATAYQTEYGSLPANAGELEEYAKFQKCPSTAGNLVQDGGKVCKAAVPVAVDAAETTFTSPSGHYLVEFDGTTGGMFRVKANPNGVPYVTNGAAVLGCYNPTTSVSEVYEYTMKTADKGAGKDYRNC
tara:strand:- start:12830 stop:13447 length:618 start_codon:yes stop_codon:yes gene_type:complete